MTTVPQAPLPHPVSAQAEPLARLPIEYWTVAMDDQDSCGACDATLTALQDAAAEIGPLAERLGITIEVSPRTIATWAQAIDHGIAASPTVRAAGHELRPAHPGDSDERMWRWRGITSATVPAAALADLLVRAVAIRSRQLGDYLAAGGPAPYLRRHLRAEDATAIPADSAPATSDGSGCRSAS